MRRRALGVFVLVVIPATFSAAYLSSAKWRSQISESLKSLRAEREESNHDHDHEGDHHDHDHDHEGDHDHESDHDHAHESEGRDDDSIVLSERARRNLGLKVEEIKLAEYWRSLIVPGFVAKYPGRSDRRISAVMTGVIRKTYVSPGQSVKAGDTLFDFQLTDEILGTSQSSLLKTLRDMEVIDAKLKRVTELVKTQTLAAKDQIELEYERGKLQTTRLAQEQELLIRGLSQPQVDEIVRTKSLLRECAILVPAFTEDLPGASTTNTAYTVEKIDVFPGKAVHQGDELCGLAFNTVLNVVGQGFEREAEVIGRAVANQWPVTAIFEVGESEPLVREGLRVLYVENALDTESRTFRFFVPLVNEVVRDNPGPGGAVYRSWRFKPGQKVRLRVPVQHMKDRIVLPAEALLKEGGEAYIFRANGDQLSQVSVRVDFQDSQTVVLANDGSLSPGDPVAMNNAYQINLALKNKTAGHAGHDHDH